MLLIIFRVAQGKGWTTGAVAQMTTEKVAATEPMRFATGPSTTILGTQQSGQLNVVPVSAQRSATASVSVHLVDDEEKGVTDVLKY